MKIDQAIKEWSATLTVARHLQRDAEDQHFSTTKVVAGCMASIVEEFVKDLHAIKSEQEQGRGPG